MHKGLKEPHVFNAGANPVRLIKNLAGILLEAELQKIWDEIDSNVRDLYRLGESHFVFACAIPQNEWRQRASRFYYGAYNARRAIVLKVNGSFSTDASDHKNVEDLPDELPNAATYRQKLKDLREDRNLADYSHLANLGDLLISTAECEVLVTQLMVDAKAFLVTKGIVL